MQNKSFSNQSTINLVKEFEASYDVTHWEVAGIQIWPVLRNNFPYMIIQSFSESSLSKQKQEKPKKFRLLLSSTFRLLKLLIKVIISPKKEVIFLGDGVSYTLINNKWVEKFCDPLIKKQNIKKYFLLEQNPFRKGQTVHRYHSLSDLQVVSYYLSRIVTYIRKPKAILFGYDDFLSKIQKIGLNNHLSKESLEIYATQIKICSIFFDFIIDLLQIKAAYVVCYYGILGYALALSCNKKQIKLTDVQHGSIFNSPAYCGWTKIPPKGYDILPHLFYLWDSHSVQEVTFSSCCNFIKYHRPIEHGLDIIDYVKKHSDLSLQKDINDYSVKFSYLILVPLQPQFFGHDDWRNLAQVIRSSPCDWGWIIRSHPAYKDRYGMEEILSIHQKNVLFDDTSLNLYNLLCQTDCLVTTASSCCIEAQMLGVPTILISKIGYEDFFPLINNGFVYYAENQSQILEKIKLVLRKKSIKIK